MRSLLLMCGAGYHARGPVQIGNSTFPRTLALPRGPGVHYTGDRRSAGSPIRARAAHRIMVQEEQVRRQSLWFEGRERVSVRDEPLEPPGAGEVHVQTVVRAISPGPEMLFYHGDLEKGTEVDVSLEGYRRRLTYPLPYGYASVGKVPAPAPGSIRRSWVVSVFAFVPHASTFRFPSNGCCSSRRASSRKDAAFLATAETSVNLVLDSAPLLGEQASVFGFAGPHHHAPIVSA